MAGQIAELIVPSDGGGAPSIVVPDWPRGKLYFVGQSSLRSYTTTVATQSPLLTVLVSPARNPWSADLDPLTGALLVNRPATTGGAIPLYRIDPNTFADTGSFGTGTGGWPASFTAAEAIACVTCGTQASGGSTLVSYAVFKESLFSGTVGVVRVDTMQQAGFYQSVVTGSTNNRGSLCRGASGASGASVFLSWNATTTPSPTIPLYTVTIAPGAELYNPASWPTTNSHIQSHTVGTIAAASVDPTWTHLACQALGYDSSDGNVLMEVNTADAVAQQRYIIKLNATNAAVVWKTALPGTTTLQTPGLPGFSVDHDILGMLGAPSYGLNNTTTGALTSATFGGWAPSANFFASNQQTTYIADDTSALFFAGGSYDGTQPNAPVAVAGTPSAFSGYALIAGLIPLPSSGGGPGGGGGTLRLAMDNVSVTAQATLLPKNLVWLSWSNDRGHSFGNPVSQPIGEAGEYRTSLQWQRLEYSRDRVFKLEWSSPQRTALQGCWVDVMPAQS